MKASYQVMGLAALIGLSGHACLSMVTLTVVPLSVFPWLVLGLAAWLLYPCAINGDGIHYIPIYAAVCLVLGALLYSVILRVQHPELGSNFLPVLLCLAILIWLAVKLKWFSRQ
ncbi:DUF1422 family protein [Celerinatantimonas yamalensis]|uniref:DUF1422 family protein n=1 Tax=Celerinatantimonas yamalensis TaxID=559956 RepID=A0ABW9G8S0_9GAMM